MRIEWLPGAISDLQRLREFIVPHNREAANRVVTVIKKSIKILSRYEYVGKPAEGMPGYYDMVIPFGISGYVLRYRVEGNTVFIIAVKHGKEAGFSDEGL
jgi:plasmid stabilization system protein ParE